MCCRRPIRVSILGLLFTCWAVVAAAAIRLPSVIGDNMILQRGQPVPIWGWAKRGEEITVAVSNPRQQHVTNADDHGRWKVLLPKLAVGRPLEMTIKGSSGDVAVLKNILVGEVWVCSGQSNMEMGVSLCDNAAEEIAAADYSRIRLFQVVKAKAPQPMSNVEGEWTLCTPKTVATGGWGGFSATAYYFGRELHKELNVPVGLISACWGGTPAEYWTSRPTLKANPMLQPLLAHGDSSCLYNAMIAPIIPYGIRGAIWYQGESNVINSHTYHVLFPAMIANWRTAWEQGDFPFAFVQIAPFRYGGARSIKCAELREAQLMTLQSAPNTGMAVTMDIGNVTDIHPRNKQEVGKRLALWALAKVHGQGLIYSGPIYKSMAVERDRIRIQFDHVGGGLVAADGKPLRDFLIAGADQNFVPAVAEIEGESIVVHSDEIAQPVAVRYAWRDDVVPNLANKEGLPASPFRTDSWQGLVEEK